MRAFTDPSEGGATLSRNAYETNSTLDISDFSALKSDFCDITCSMVGTMKSETRKGFETIGQAAARLLQGMAQRAKRPAGENPAEIAESGEVPRAGEKAGSRGETGEATPQGSPQLTVTGRGVGDGFEIANGNGSPVFSGKFPVGYANDNGLPNREDAVLTERAVTRSRLLEG